METVLLWVIANAGLIVNVVVVVGLLVMQVRTLSQKQLGHILGHVEAAVALTLQTEAKDADIEALKAEAGSYYDTLVPKLPLYVQWAITAMYPRAKVEALILKVWGNFLVAKFEVDESPA
jgi:hypothetical protein